MTQELTCGLESFGGRCEWQHEIAPGPEVAGTDGTAWHCVTHGAWRPAVDIHKARPYGGDANPGQYCVVCQQRVKRVPGGQGPTWVHTDTGAVVAHGADPDFPILDPRESSK